MLILYDYKELSLKAEICSINESLCKKMSKNHVKLES